MYKILVTGVGGDIGRGIVKSIAGRGFNIIGTDCKDILDTRFLDKFINLPNCYTHKSLYLDKLTSLLSNNIIDLMFIGSDPETHLLSFHDAELDVPIIVSNKESIVSLTNKLNLQLLLKNAKCNWIPSWGSIPFRLLGINIFKHYKSFIIRPKTSSGSRGVSIIDNPKNYFSIPFNSFAQEYIEGEEFTVGLHFGPDLNLGGTIILKRVLENGKTVYAETGDFPVIKEEVHKIVKMLKSFKVAGPINLQLKQRGNKAYCFEVNPRFSGTTYFRTLLGWNEPMACIDEYLNIKPRRLSHRQGRVIRIVEETLINV